MLAGAAQDGSKPAEADPKMNSVDKAKKKLKGLFGK
jgi:hypothetical protein